MLLKWVHLGVALIFKFTPLLVLITWLLYYIVSPLPIPYIAKLNPDECPINETLVFGQT